MMSYSPAIVVDANVAVRAVLPVETKLSIMERFAGWHQSHTMIYAPDILLPEIVSVIRRGIFDRWITEAEGQVAVDDVFRLGVEIVSSDANLCQAALAWAARLGQSKAYDGFYLAVAERTEAELWTVDERLYNRAHQLGISWVHHAGEE
jgi:predicted nucleic acid-binding protein